jgi:hypothetical protein
MPPTLSRRHFLQSLASLAVLAKFSAVSKALGQGARVLVVGAGMAGIATARALADVWIESDSDSEDPVELPPTGNVYCLSDAEPDAQPAGPGDRPPTEKHSVATVNTQWKTTTSGYQTIRALCDSGCNGTATKKWLALAILAVTKGTMTKDRAGDRLLSATGHAFTALGSVKLRCWVGGIPIDHWYAVYDDSLPFDVVWGTDFSGAQQPSWTLGR